MLTLEIGTNLRLDFGTAETDGYGIPYTITTSRAALVPLTYGTDGEDYHDESDWFDASGALQTGDSVSQAYMPWPQDAAIEGWQGTPATDPDSGDRHILVIDQSTCTLMESWNSVRLGNGFQVSNTAVFNLSKTLPQRPDDWTSGDAAGLPIYPLLLKYSEVASGSINHAIRFTALRAQNAYSYPASHKGPSGNTNISYPYYGARFRLKQNFNIDSYSTDAQVFLTALKKYGLIFADQGSTAYISGTSDPGWENFIPEINTQKKIPFSQFEMVQSPYPITRGWTPTSLMCNGVSSNPSAYTPTWTPTCGSSPVPAPHPNPVPGPAPNPVPGPAPNPVPGPAPNPVPGPAPNPVPGPAPAPSPDVPAPSSCQNIPASLTTEEILSAIAGQTVRNAISNYLTDLPSTVGTIGDPETNEDGSVTWRIALTLDDVLTADNKATAESLTRINVACAIGIAENRVTCTFEETQPPARRAVQLAYYDAVITISGAAQMVASALLSLILLVLFI